LNIWFVGYILGVLCAPFVNDRFGRKGSSRILALFSMQRFSAGFIIGNTLSLLASLLRTAAIVLEWPELFVAGRAICSFAIAMSFAALLLYLQVIFGLFRTGQSKQEYSN
jgi:MFS family permease